MDWSRLLTGLDRTEPYLRLRSSGVVESLFAKDVPPIGLVSSTFWTTVVRRVRDNQQLRRAWAKVCKMSHSILHFILPEGPFRQNIALKDSA
jgi:hypothetical protein